MNSSLRIGLVCPYSLSLPGGVQGQVLSMARILRSRGHEARVLAPCDGPPPDPWVTPLGKSVPAASNGSMAPIAPDPACALRTIHALRNERFDVVHVHEPIAPGPPLTSLVVADAPIVATFHAAGSDTHYGKVLWVTKRLANRIKVRVAVSQDAANLAKSKLGGEYELLYNGIDVDLYDHAKPVRKSGRAILFVGRHEPRKGLSLLIEAMKVLPDDVSLWIGGTGPQTQALKTATRDDPRIEWLGRITEAEKLARLNAADIFCAPSLEGESFGIVLLEAMAACTAIVASDLPGYRKVARDGKDARLFAAGSISELTSALQDLLAHDSLRGAYQEAGFERANMFSMKSLTEKYEAIYRRAINESR